MNRKTSAGGGSGGGQGMKDKAVFLVQVAPPYSLFLPWQQLCVAAMLFHHLSPGCKSQVQHGPSTHLSQEWPYRVWIRSLSKSVHIYMKLTYICFTEWQGNPYHLLEDESSCWIGICAHNGNKSTRTERSTSLGLFCSPLGREFSLSLRHISLHIG